jgi:hypothetical protein
MPISEESVAYQDELTYGINAAENWLYKESQGNPDVFPGSMRADIPKELVEAVIQLESGWDKNAVADTGNTAIGPAIGLMQVTPHGAEASMYRRVSGQSVTERDLFNPSTNIEVGSFGLGYRYAEVREITDDPHPSWFLAGARYFGYSIDEGGNVGSESDRFGTTCGSYMNTLRQHVIDTYGEERADELGEGTGEGTTPGDVIDTGKDVAQQGLDSLVAFIQEYAPIVLLIGAGILVTVLGVVIIVRM